MVVLAGTRAVVDLKQKYPGVNVDFMRCDLASFESVRNLANDFLSRNLPLHVLINNAGVMMPDHAMSPEVRICIVYYAYIYAP